MSPISTYLLNLVDYLRGTKHKISIFKTGMVITIVILVTYIIILTIEGYSHL